MSELKLILDSIDDVKKDVGTLTKILTGNGDPEKGLCSQFYCVKKDVGTLMDDRKFVIRKLVLYALGGAGGGSAIVYGLVKALS